MKFKSHNDAYEDIYAAHSATLAYAEVRRQPVLVVFSAIPGSGKSELTRRLAADYGFLRVANKDIRSAITATGHEGDVDISDYRLWLLDKLTKTQMPSIVFDHNIDQWYQPSKAWAEQRNYRYVLVRIDVNRKLLEQRLLKREGSRNAKAFAVLDEYETEHKKLAGEITPTIVLEGDYDLDVAAKRIATA